MSNLKIIGGINLFILIFYTILINATSTGSERDLSVALGLATCIGIQVIVNLITAIIYFIGNNPPLAKSYLLSSGLVLLIGFSACLGSVS